MKSFHVFMYLNLEGSLIVLKASASLRIDDISSQVIAVE